ncbi:monoacylglycerol lipase-like isoform X2 [Juglans microcarpa x Juglans regia]|uniref:monoacylglycerol lipase-like isoform X2 n=1 Tax=Juglans microcarpa x Juglans regia TaxID=2249226 RepID=UPI001B7DA2D4|nr:monoacylglycerol lipase-like isoform X2 [Juglans microcarpa x Juglans regia]
MICLSKTPVSIPIEIQIPVLLAKPSPLHVRKRNLISVGLTRYEPGFFFRWKTKKMANALDTSPLSLMLTSGASGRMNALLSPRVWRSLVMLINAFVLLLLVPVRGRRRSPSSSWPRREEKREESGGTQHHHRKGGDCGPLVRVSAKILPWLKRSVVEQEVAARRALAMRRVLQDDADGKSLVREYSLFVTTRGDTIFTQSWTPVSIRKSGRYNDFAKQLNANGFKAYGMDWIGHGGSDGLHAYVHSLDDAITDMKSFIRKILAENPGLPCFCFGHSTGAAIVLKAMHDPKVEARVSGAVLTSPAVGVKPSHPIFAVLAPIFSFLLPKYQLRAAIKKGTPVSRDPNALIAKYSDPLVYTGSIRVRTGYEILQITSYLQQNLSKLRVPFLVLHGTADTVTDPEASQKLYEEASSADKAIKLYEGCLHDLLFELEREAIVEDIIEWLNCRV